MKCSVCFDEIKNEEAYFQGTWIPSGNEFGERKFGCAPNYILCQECGRHLPTPWDFNKK